MKKITVLAVCFMMLIAALTGCGNKTFDVSVYDNVLNEVKRTLALSEEAVAPEGMEGIFEFGQIYGDEALDLLGYKYQDVNGDNIPELLIGVSLNDAYPGVRNQIYLLYAVADGKPQQILSSSARSSYSMLSDGTFAYFSSAGAAYSIFGEFALTKENALDCTNYYFTHEVDGDFENIGVYHNSTGNFDVVSSNLTELSLEEFAELEEELLLRILPLEGITPLRDFQ